MTTSIQTQERPIILHSHEVAAAQKHGRVQIQRVIEPQPTLEFLTDSSECRIRWTDEKNDIKAHSKSPDIDRLLRLLFREYKLCPYGKPGDALWHRETWRVASWDEDFEHITIEYKSGGLQTALGHMVFGDDLFGDIAMHEKLSNEAKANGARQEEGCLAWDECPIKWRSPVTMPRNASRLLLSVTDVQVQRVDDPWVWGVSAEVIES